MKALQYFTQTYLEQCKNMTEVEVIKFLDDFRHIHSPKPSRSSRLISLKIDEQLLNSFKTRAQLDGVPYQSRIKQLMRDWLTKAE